MKFWKLFTVVTALIASSSANAATYNIDLVVDLMDQRTDSPYFFSQDVPTYLPQVQTGDVINTNITFANGQGLQIKQTSLPQPIYLPIPGPDGIEYELVPPSEEQRLSIYYTPAPGVATGTPANIRAENRTELTGLIGDF